MKKVLSILSLLSAVSIISDISAMENPMPKQKHIDTDCDKLKRI